LLVRVKYCSCTTKLKGGMFFQFKTYIHSSWTHSWHQLKKSCKIVLNTSDVRKFAKICPA
jgi:hypothetical protein